MQAEFQRKKSHTVTSYVICSANQLRQGSSYDFFSYNFCDICVKKIVYLLHLEIMSHITECKWKALRLMVQNGTFLVTKTVF